MYHTTDKARLARQFNAHLSNITPWDDVEFMASDAVFLASQFTPVPGNFRPKLIREYTAIKAAKGRKDANTWAQDLRKLFGGRGLDYAADDSEIDEAAERAARNVSSKLPHFTSEVITRKLLGNIAEQYDIALPKIDKIEKLIARMSAERWWRRQLRSRFSKFEAAAIQTGFVHKRSGLYTRNRRGEKVEPLK